MSAHAELKKMNYQGIIEVERNGRMIAGINYPMTMKGDQLGKLVF